MGQKGWVLRRDSEGTEEGSVVVLCCAVSCCVALRGWLVADIKSGLIPRTSPPLGGCAMVLSRSKYLVDLLGASEDLREHACLPTIARSFRSVGRKNSSQIAAHSIPHLA